MPGPVKAFVVVALLVVSTAAYGAFEYPPGSVVNFGMSGAFDLSHPSALDLYYHPALVCAARFNAELSYARLYDLPDFEHISGSATWRWREFSSGVGASQLTGGDYYWERSLFLMISTGIWRGLRVGCGLNSLSIQFSGGYADLHLTALSAGILAPLGKKLILASSIRNINHPSYGPGTGAMPVTGEVAASLMFSDGISFHLAHHFEAAMRDKLSFGMKAKMHRILEIFWGLAADPTEFGGGLSLSLGDFRFDYGFRDNVYLGGTHRVGMRIEH